MKQSEFKSLIREEIKKALNEDSIDQIGDPDKSAANRIPYLYDKFGVSTNYGPNVVKKFDQYTVDKAIEMAPKILKLQQQIKKMFESPEGKILMALAKARGEYGGTVSKDRPAIDDLF